MAAAAEAESNVFVAVRIRPRIQNALNAAQSAERHLPTAAARVGDDSIRMTDLKTSMSTLAASPSSATFGAASPSGAFGASSSMKFEPSAADVKTQSFTFDAVFDEGSTQEELYHETTLGAVDAALQGGNSTIMTYGQTGSGKTFTVLGVVSQNPLDGDDVVVKETGLFLRVLRDILHFRKQRESVSHVVVCISVIEIYLDNVRDLLGKDPSANLKVAIHTESVEMPDLTVQPIDALRDAVACYKRATARRVSRATDANDQSSRSHAVFSIEIFQQERTDKNPEPMSVKDLMAAKEKGKSKAAAGQLFSSGVAGNPPVRHSRIVLTDLAGSEKMKSKNSKGEALEEMKKINSSLTCLGNVVHSLYSGSKHIPYRDSKLTIILRSSFASPRAHVVLIANVAPTSLTFDETLSTLFFANKVKAMKAQGGGEKDAANVLLESDMLQTVKTAEDLCHELTIAEAAYGFNGYRPAVCRRTGVRVGKSGMPRQTGMTPKAIVAEAVTKHQQECAQAKAKDAATQQTELDELREKLFDERVKHTVHRRALVEGRIDEATREKQGAASTSGRWEQEQATEASSAESEAKKVEAELGRLKPREAQLQKTLVEVNAELQRIQAALAKIEADYKAAHAEEAKQWDAEDAADAERTDFFNSQKRVVELRKEGRAVRGEFAEVQAAAHGHVVASAQAEEDYRHELLSEWIKPIVFGIVDRAEREARQATRGAVGLRRPPPSVGVRPSVRPSARPPAAAGAGGGSSGSADRGFSPPRNRPAGKHADPTSPAPAAAPAGGDGPRARPKLPPKPPPRKPDAAKAAAAGDADQAQAPAQLPAPSGPAPGSPKRVPPPPPPQPKPALTVFDNPDLVRDVVAYVGSGAMLLKHGRSGRPHLRWFYLAAPNNADVTVADPRQLRLYYCEDRDLRGTPGLPSIPMAAVSAITLGQGTPVFERMKRRDDYYKSLSLHYMDKQEQRTLDVVCGTLAEYEAWVIAFCAVTKCNPHFAKPMAEIERLPPGQELEPEEVELCREWHIRPQMMYSTRARLEETRERRQAPSLPLTPGALRNFVSTDIFRGNVMWRRFVDVGIITRSVDVQQYLDFADFDDGEEGAEGEGSNAEGGTPTSPAPMVGSPAAAR